MDPLPLSLNQHQLNLMHSAVNRVMTDLQQQHKAGQLSSNDDTQRERNISTYGTNQYDEALARVQTIEEQLKSQIEAWHDQPEKSCPVSLSLDSYQLQILRLGIEQELDTLQDGKHSESQSPEQNQQLLKGIIEQLPEHSPQEDSD